MKNITFGFLFLLVVFELSAQKIYYSLTERNKAQNLSYEILGKFNQSYLVYKNLRNEHKITVYNAEMEIKEEVYLDFISDRSLDVACYNVGDGVAFIYQYQKKNVIYCMGAKVNAAGQLIGSPVIIDTAMVSSYNNDRQIYSSVVSEDKKRLMVLKILNPYRDEYEFKTCLLNASLEKQRSSSFRYTIESTRESFADFSLDNGGNFLFTHIPKSAQRDMGSSVNLCVLPAGEDSLYVNVIRLGKVFPDEMRIKIDNYNRRYILTSFYANSRRGNIEGLIYLNFSSDSMRLVQQRFFEFTDELKNIAKGENSMNAAFNDYYLKHFLIKKDGSVIVTAESSYTNNRSPNMSRWDHPFNWGWGGWGMGSGFYGWGSPFNNWGWGMPGGWNNFGTPSVRYYSDNIVLFSIDEDAGMEWNNVLNKTQFDDNSDALLSYQTMNTGKEILFLYNEWSRRSPMLTSQILSADGNLARQQPLRNMDRGIEFIIRKARQVGSRELIVPVYLRNSISFARIQF